VTVLTAKNEDKFSTSEPELAKVLLFTDKSSTSNLYKALSVDFHHRLAFGEVRKKEKDLVEKYEISTYPTLIVLTTSGERIPYDKDLKHDTLFKFLEPFAKPVEHAGTNTDSSEPKEPKPKKEAPAPPPDVVYDPRKEFSSSEEFEKLCMNTAKSCLVAILDPVNTDAETHEKYVKILSEVHDKQSKFFNILWINGVAQPEFLRALNLYSGFPALVVLNHKKSAAVDYIGAFSVNSINDFCGSVMRGAKRPYPLKAFPSVVTVDATVEAAASAKDEL